MERLDKLKKHKTDFIKLLSELELKIVQKEITIPQKNALILSITKGHDPVYYLNRLNSEIAKEEKKSLGIKKSAAVSIVAIVLFLGIFSIFFRGTPTGHVTFEKYDNFTLAVNKEYSNNTVTEYYLIINNTQVSYDKLRYLGIDAAYRGVFRVFLIKNYPNSTQEFLVYDSSINNPQNSGNVITGMVTGNSDLFFTNDSARNPLDENASLNLSRNFSENTSENTTDNTSSDNLENSSGNVQENITHNTASEITTNVTANISENNSEINIENITLNVSELNTSELNTSENSQENTSVNTSEENIRNNNPNPLQSQPLTMELTDACMETCLLDLTNNDLSLRIEVDDNSSLDLYSIHYSQAYKNHPPLQIRNISDIELSSGQKYVMNLSGYFIDPDNDKILYDTKSAPELGLDIHDELLSIDTKQASGDIGLFIYATDGNDIITSNTFYIKIIGNATNVSLYNESFAAKQAQIDPAVLYALKNGTARVIIRFHTPQVSLTEANITDNNLSGARFFKKDPATQLIRDRIRNRTLERKDVDKFLKKSAALQTLQDIANQSMILVEQDINDLKSAVISRSDLDAIIAAENVESVSIDNRVSALVYDSMNITEITKVQEQNFTGNGVKVCIPDSGFSYNIFNMSLGTDIFGYDFINNNPDPLDDNGHGTEVAYPVHIIAPLATLYIAKVIGSDGTGYESDVIAGIQYCMDQNVSIISLSLGSGLAAGYCDENPLSQKINEAVSKGIYVFAATGNDASHDSLRIPSCAMNATRVAASTKTDQVAAFSNVNDIVDLLAPGDSINTMDNLGDSVVRSGTSFSSPIAAGAAALILESKNELIENISPSDLKYLFRSTADIISFSGHDLERINAYNALIGNITHIPAQYTANQTENITSQTYSVLYSSMKNPKNAANVSGGSVEWVLPNEALTENARTANVTLAANGFSFWLKLTNFSFNIPAGATITGIAVNIKASAANNARIRLSNVSLVKNDVIQTGTQKKNTNTWITTLQYNYSVGSKSDLWGDTWTPTNINNETFGVALIVNTTTTGTTARIDIVNMTVYYVYNPGILFSAPTPNNDTTTVNTSALINISITNATIFSNFVFNWNGVNYNYYNESLYLLMGFNNLSALGETATRFVDSSSYETIGSCSGGLCPVVNISGKYGSCLSFDGTNQVTLSQMPVLKNATVLMWLKPGAQNGAYDPGLLVAGTTGIVYGFATAPGDRIATYQGSGANLNYSDTNLAVNSWNFIAVSINGTNASYYLNGVYDGSGIFDTGGAGFAPTLLGSNSNPERYNGLLDELMVYNRSLTADEINQIYKTNIYKYDSDKWSILINQSNLSFTTYTYYANVSVGPFTNQTDTRYLTVVSNAPFTFGINFTNAAVNNTFPMAGAVVNFSINITSNRNVSGYIFSFYNDTLPGWQNDSFTIAVGTPPYYFASAIKTIPNQTYFNYSWFANDTANSWNQSMIYSLIVDRLANISYSNFNGSTTNFSNLRISQVNNISNVTLEVAGVAKIIWNNNVNAIDSNFDANVMFTPNSAYVNASGLNSTFNSSANVTIYYSPYTNPVPIRDGILCTSCNILGLSGSNLTFNVSGFSNYTTAQNTTLRIWDNNENNISLYHGNLTKTINQGFELFANYTNQTSGVLISSGNCTLVLSTGFTVYNMTYNSTIGLYVYNTTFSSYGSYSYNISCNATGFARLTRTDSFTIGQLDFILGVNFTIPTPANNTVTPNTSVMINISINASSSGLSKFIWNWNGTNYTFYDDSLIFMMNFDNVSSLGEGNNNFTYDASIYGINGTCIRDGQYGADAVTENCSWTAGKYGSGIQFNASKNESVYLGNSTVWPNGTNPFTICSWAKTDSTEYDEYHYYFSSGNHDAGGHLFYLGRLGDMLVMGPGNYQYSSYWTAGAWYHICVAVNSTTAAIYSNGTYLDSADWNYTIARDAAYIGQFDWGFWWNGSVDEVMIWNRTLSAAEINQLYHSNFKKYSTTDWQFITNQSDLGLGKYSYYGYAKNSADNFNQTDVRYLTIAYLIPPGINFTAPTPPDGGVTTNFSAVINITINDTSSTLSTFVWNWNATSSNIYDDSLVLMMNMNNVSSLGENSTSNLVYDASKYSNNGTCSNMGAGCNWTSGKYGNGVYFNQLVYPEISISNPAGLPQNNSNRTACVWVKPNAVDSPLGGGAILSWGGTDYTQSFAIRQAFYNTITIDYWGLESNSAAVLSAGVWIYICAQYNGTHSFLYVNGTLATVAAYGPINTNSIFASIGSYGYAGSSFNGSIDEVMIWDRVLSASEIQQLYYSNFRKRSSNEWIFTANETNLSVGPYTYYGYAKNINDSANLTEIRTLNVRYQPLADCTALSSNMTYVMTADITYSVPTWCFTCDGQSNIFFDCAGHKIKGKNDVNDIGFSANATHCQNVTIQNCVISNMNTGMYFDDFTNSFILNSKISDSSMGIYLFYNSASDNFSNITIQNATSDGIASVAGSSSFTGITINASAEGIGFGVNGGNYVKDTVITNSVYVGINLSDSNNYFENVSNELLYNGTASKFNSGYSQNISSEKNMGWWPRAESDGSDADDQSRTAWYNKTFGRNSDGSINNSLRYWYNNTGYIPLTISFTSPTPNNRTVTGNSSVMINMSVSVISYPLSKFVWNWNYTNYTFYDSSLVFMANLNNVSTLGENSTTIKDLSIYGNNGTVLGNAKFNFTGRYGGAYDFNATPGGFIDFGNSAVIPNGTSNRTFCAWARTKDTSGTKGIIGTGNTSNGGAFQLLRDSDALRIDYWGSNTTLGGFFAINSWTHVCISYDGINVSAYKDGQLFGTSTSAGWSTIRSKFYIGSGLQNEWNGSIDDVMIWNRTLLASEVQQLYFTSFEKYSPDGWRVLINESNLTSGIYSYYGNVSDSSGNTSQTDIRSLTVNNIPPGILFMTPTPANGTIKLNSSTFINISINASALSQFFWNWNTTNYFMYNDSLLFMFNFDNVSSIGDTNNNFVDLARYANATCPTALCPAYAAGRYGMALYFDGTKNLTLPSTAVNDFTVMMWIKPDVNQVGPTGYNFIIGTGFTEYGIYITNKSLTAHPYKIHFNDGGTSFSNTNLTFGAWNFIAVVRNGTKSSFYLNGNFDGNGTGSGDSLPLDIIGDDSFSNEYYSGSMDEVRVYNHVLTSAEIKQAYYSNLNRYSTDSWRFQANISNISLGTYSYYGSASDTIRGTNQTAVRYLTISNVSSITFVAPSDANASWVSRNYTYINITTSLTDIACYLNWSGVSSVMSGAGTNYYLNKTDIANNSYIYSVRCNDTENNVYSSDMRNITINASYSLPEKVGLVSPANNSATVHERRPVFLWGQTNNTLWYEINITSNNCLNIFSNATTPPTTTFTPTQDLCLNTESGGGTYYNWAVRACNSNACGPWSDTWKFSIEPYVVITLTSNSINFGEVSLGQTYDTTSGTPGPLVVENDGNVQADLVNISATSPLWSSRGLGTKYLKMKARVSSEPGSFNTSSSSMSFVNVSTSNVTVISQLNYTSSSNSAYVDVGIEVPGDEPSGNKSTNLIFYWVQTP